MDEQLLRLINHKFSVLSDSVERALTRPSVLYHPKLWFKVQPGFPSSDGKKSSLTFPSNVWIAQYEGLAAYGYSPAEAMRAFDRDFYGQ